MDLCISCKKVIGLLFFAIILLTSCHRSGEVPAPEVFKEYPQPETVPLDLSESSPLHWDTLAKGAIRPAVFPLDFSKIKGIPYDTSVFKPLPEKPFTSPFNFSTLPSRAFDLDKIEARSLEMKAQVLRKPPSPVPVEPHVRIAAATMDIREWQQITRLNLVIRGMQLNSAGILWLATSNGIYSIDGTDLTNVLPGFVADGIFLDREGNLWTFDVTNQTKTVVVKIDFKNKKVERSLPGFNIGSLAFMIMDKTGNIWISGASTSPPLMINTKDMKYRMLGADAGFKSSRYYYPYLDKENRVWYGSRNGIEIIDNSEKKVYQVNRSNGLIGDTVSAITADKKGRIWLATAFGTDVISANEGIITHYVVNRGGGIFSFRLLFDNTGLLWSCNQDGPGILNPDNLTFRNTGQVKGISNGLVTDMVEYKTGQIVFAGVTGNGSHSLYSIDQFGKTVHPFGNTSILSTTEDSRGNLWVGTDSGLFVVDTFRSRYFKLNIKDGLANPSIQSVTEQQGKVVITTNDGYNIFDPEKNELLRVNKKDGLITDSVYSLMADNDGNEWIVGNSAGIIKYDATNHVFMQVDTKGGLNGNTIVQSLNIGNNKVVIVPVDGGPAIIDTKKNTIQTIKKNELINSFTYKGLMLDSKKRLWIYGSSGNTQYGLFMVDIPNNTLTHFATNEGLPNNLIYSALEFKGRVLVGTYQKVAIITPPESSANKKWETSILANSENLKKNTNSYASDAISKRGNYIWGDDGLSIIYGIRADTSSALDVVKGISVMGTELSFTNHDTFHRGDSLQEKELKSLSAAGYTTGGDIRWDSLSGPFYLPVNLSLPYDQNVIQFHFGEISEGRLDSIYYLYILEGIDKKWTKTIKPETETYLNLPPGDYTFKVASRWKNGKWNKPAVYTFTIRPPWYMTWWAYTLFALLAALLLWLVVRIQKARVIARERQRSEVREAKLNADAENERRRNIELISEMGRDITGSLSFKSIINTVYGHVNKLMDASVFGVGIYNKEKNLLEFPATKENGTTLSPYSYDVEDPNRPACWCFRNKKRFIVNDFEKEHKEYISDIEDTVAGNHASSIIYLPLIHKGNCMGVITAQSFNTNAYNDYHINILESLATYAAVALDNAETYRSLQTMQTQLVQSEKMASLGELTAGIAHEIQNPLNFVNNFSEVNIDLIDEMNEEIRKGNLEEVKDIASNIRGNEEKIIFHGKRADGIVKSMLQHSRSSSDTRVLTDVNNLCDEYLRLAFHGMRAKDKSFNSGMETKFDENAGKVNIVPQDIGRVLLNLLTNAFYEVNEKRKAEIEGYLPMVRIETIRSEKNIQINVSDNGRGITEEIRKKIFQPFFTTKPTGKGTGLGLSLSYDIVKAHGGELSVSSVPGESTQFKIILPIS